MAEDAKENSTRSDAFHGGCKMILLLIEVLRGLQLLVSDDIDVFFDEVVHQVVDTHAHIAHKRVLARLVLVHFCTLTELDLSLIWIPLSESV